jgi:hypothetical protein
VAVQFLLQHEDAYLEDLAARVEAADTRTPEQRARWAELEASLESMDLEQLMQQATRPGA